MITTAHAHKSGVIFHCFPRAFKQKKIKALRPKMTKIASRGGPALIFYQSHYFFFFLNDVLAGAVISTILSHLQPQTCNWIRRFGPDTIFFEKPLLFSFDIQPEEGPSIRAETSYPIASLWLEMRENWGNPIIIVIFRPTSVHHLSSRTLFLDKSTSRHSGRTPPSLQHKVWFNMA